MKLVLKIGIERFRSLSATSTTTSAAGKRSKGGQFALHAKALPGNPYDGHTLAQVIPDMEASVGAEIERVLADAGYKGHNAPLSHKAYSLSLRDLKEMMAERGISIDH